MMAASQPRRRPIGRGTAMNVNRRELLFQWANGFGGLALLGLMSSCSRGPRSDLVAASPAGRAKSIIFLFMDGGPSHMDTFDPKPRLEREHGQTIKMKIVNRLSSNTVLKS